MLLLYLKTTQTQDKTLTQRTEFTTRAGDNKGIMVEVCHAGQRMKCVE